MDSQARSPSGTVLINGAAASWLTWAVTNNAYYSADHFELTLPVSTLPKGLMLADLSDAADLEVEIRASLDGSAGTSLIIGRVDEVSVDYLQMEVSLTGRDHTADMIETKTNAGNYKNQTSSQVVQTIAAAHGLTADVTATTAKVGKYIEIDHDKLTNEESEWDLLTYLAEKEGFDVFVTGKTVHFHPVSETYGDPIPVTYTPPTSQSIAQGDFIKLSTKRSLTLASDVAVNVYSWNHKQKAAFKVTAKAQPTKRSARAGGSSQTYTFRVPGLTKDEATQLAQKKLEDITRHERVIDLSLSADLVTLPRRQIKLSGTGTSFDQLYWIDEVERRMSFDEGFDMTVKAKNHSPQSTVSI